MKECSADRQQDLFKLLKKLLEMKLLRLLKSKQKLKELEGQISTPTWQGLDKPKQRASSPIVEVLFDSVGT